MDDKIRKRDRGLRGKAFRFSGKITGFTFSGSSQHDRIQELNTELGHRFLACKGNYDLFRWISYVVLSFEVGRVRVECLLSEKLATFLMGYIQIFASCTTILFSNLIISMVDFFPEFLYLLDQSSLPGSNEEFFNLYCVARLAPR